MSSIMRARNGLTGRSDVSEVIGLSPELKVAGPSMLGVGCPDRHALPHITRSKHIDPDSCSLPRERVRSSEPKAAARPWRVEPPTQQTPAGKQEAGDPAALHMFAVAVILAVSA